MATHSIFLAQRIPWIEELGRPQSMGLQSGLQLSTHTLTVIAIFQHKGHSESTENNTFIIGRQN